MMTLYKNGQEIISGLKRTTYIQTFENIRKKNPAQCRLLTAGNDLMFVAGDDRYVLRGGR